LSERTQRQVFKSLPTLNISRVTFHHISTTHTTLKAQNMTLRFGTAQKVVAEQVNKGVSIDDVDTLAIPLDGKETQILIASLNER
jgi:hypothetical protein